MAVSGSSTPEARGSAPRGEIIPVLARQIPHRLLQIFIRRMRVSRRRCQVAVPGEPLGQQQVPGCPVKVRDGAVAKRMKSEETIESGFFLPILKGVLRPPLG